MRRSSVFWVISTINRCLLGGLLLVSFTASASVDATQAFSVAHYRPLSSQILKKAAISGTFFDILHENDPIIILPGQIGLGPEFSQDASTAPRFQAKLGSDGETRVNTLGKSDPLPDFVPDFAGQTPDVGLDIDTETRGISEVYTRSSDTAALARGLTSSGLTPKAVSTGTTPLVTGYSTLSLALLHPSPSLLTASTEHSKEGVSIVTKALPPPKAATPRPVYSGVIPTSDLEKEQRCLAEAVYFEARSEPEQGQAAVAQVVLNRLKSEYYPKTICDVVYQNRERYLGCEFTFACEGKSLAVNEAGSWAVASRIAKQVYDGVIFNAEVGYSTHYHADYVRPYWAKAMEKRDTIGRHIFYSLKPGLPGGVCPGCLLAKVAG